MKEDEKPETREGEGTCPRSHTASCEIQSLSPYAAGCQEAGDPGRLGQTSAFIGGGIRDRGLVNDQPQDLKRVFPVQREMFSFIQFLCSVLVAGGKDRSGGSGDSVYGPG